MLKNKRIIGILVGICVLLCSIIILTISMDKGDSNKTQETPITDTNNNQTENKETVDNTLDKTKEETSKEPTNTTEKSEESDTKNNTQTAPKEEKLPAKDSNQSQANTPTIPETTTQYVYVSIDCKTILNNMNDLEEQYKQYVPSNGIILSSKKVKINEGDTVYDVITKVTKMKKIQMEQNAGYIKSINKLPEKLFNGSGGWLYSVNGTYADKGSKEYKLKNNDKVEWRYTCYVGDIY